MQVSIPTRSLAGRIARDQSGLALLEFAFAMPLVLMIGLYALETANLALTNLRVSQIALNLADNASRVGLASSSATEQLREVDINDVLQAARLQGSPINLSANGRIILSSLEYTKQPSYDTAYTQRIHWQRCFGQMSGTDYDSHYGTTLPTDGIEDKQADDGTTVPNGMGDTGAMVTAPQDNAVMFVEINYKYQPIVGAWLFGVTRIHYIASFIVRDNRDLTQIFNPGTATRSTCDLHNA